MPLIKNKYGKGRVRVMRIHRDGDKHEVSQLNVKAMIEGDFARAYTHADNSTAVSTDTIKNVVNIVARQNTGLCTEEFCQVLAKKYLDTYPQVASVNVTAHETKWSRLSFGGKPHPHSFVLDSNAKILATLLEVFGTTYSASVQDSLYRMGEAALAAVPEISEISMACPNMHFILMNLSAFGLDNNNDVFLPTDEPHGQIECTVSRG